MADHQPLANLVPTVSELEARKGFLLSELQLVKQLLRVAAVAEKARRLNVTASTFAVRGAASEAVARA